MKLILITFCLLMTALLCLPNIPLAADYYIDKDSRGGTCSDSNPGTITQPWCNFKVKLWDHSFNGVQAGGTIWIRGATYTGYGLWINVNALTNGTADNPITIRSYPGETVVFDSNGTGSRGIYPAGGQSHIRIIGPMEFRNYGNQMESSAAYVKYDWVIDNVHAYGGGRGMTLRNFNGITILNSTSANSNNDGEARGFGFSNSSTGIVLKNVTAYGHNDGRASDGDADGIWTDESCGTLLIDGATVYGNSEDGIDTKAASAVIKNVKSFDNTTVGVKVWGWSGQTTHTFDLTNILVYNNGEDGFKCSVGAEVSLKHLTAWGNGDSGVRLAATGCRLTLTNSILAGNRHSALDIFRPNLGASSSLTSSHNLFYHSTDPVITTNCASFPGKWSASQITNGAMNADLSAGAACNGFGLMNGSSTGDMVGDPQFVNAPPVFVTSSISAGAIENAAAVQFVDSIYPWQSYAIGNLLELNNDNVLRKITSIDNTARTITFAGAPVASPLCGRGTDCKGIRIVQWGPSVFNLNDNYNLKPASPAIGAGIGGVNLGAYEYKSDTKTPAAPTGLGVR